MDRSFGHRWVQRGSRLFSNYRFPLLLGAIGTIAVLILGQKAIERENFLLEELVGQEAAAIEKALDRELSFYVTGIERMAGRWRDGGGTPRELWEPDAAAYLRDFTAYQAIERVDPSFRTRWIVAATGTGIDKNVDPVAENKDWIQEKSPRVPGTPPLGHRIVLPGGGQAFLVVVPLFVGERYGSAGGERFDGWIVGVLRWESLFERNLSLPPGYRLQISEDGRSIYGENPPPGSRWTKTLPISAYGNTWVVRVYPSDDRISESRTLVPTMIVGGGTIGVWLLSLSLMLLRRSRVYERELLAEITLRRELEAKARSDEERWQLALQGNQDGIWDWNIQTDEIFYSPRCREMLGYTEDEYGNSAVERIALLHPDDRDAVTRALQDHLSQKTPLYLCEYRVRGKDGSYQWVLDRGQALWNEAGAPIRMIGSYTDITERKRADTERENLIRALENSVTKLFQSEARFQAFMNHSPMAAWITDRDGIALYANRTYSECLHPLCPDVVGKSPEELYPPAIAEALRDGLRRAIEKQSVSEMTLEIPHPDGAIAQFSLYQFPIADMTGRELVGAIALDVTERKRSEEEIARLAEIVRYSEDAIISKNLDGIVTSWNAGAEKLFGYGSGEIIGRSIELLFLDDDRREETEILERIRRGEAIEHYQTVRRKKDGTRIQVSESISPIQDRRGTIIGASKIVRDISERYRIEEALRESESRFQQIVAASPSLIYTVVREVTGRVHYTYLSPAFEVIFETPVEIGVNLPSFRFVHPDDRAAYLEAIARSAEFQELFRHEWRIVTPSGKVKWIRASSRPERRENGEMVWYGVAGDITEQKQAEQQLELQAVIARNMAEGICLLRADTQIIVYTNPKFDRMFGYETGELIGRPISIINRAEDETEAESVNQAILELLATGESVFEVENVRKDGTSLWCRATASTFNHPEHGAVFVVVRQDITARKQAEEALQQRVRRESALLAITGAIRQSLEFREILATAVTEVRQILEVDRVAVYRFHDDWSGDFTIESVAAGWKSLDGEIVEDTYLQETGGGRFQNHESRAVNDIYEAGLQSCHRELLERFQARAYAVVPIFAGNALWGLLAIYQNSRPRTWQSWEVESLQQIATHVAIAIQQSDLYRQVKLELTERQSAEREAKQALRAAETANAAKSTFLANMSHELRTPLNAILGFARVMTNDPAFPAEHREHVEIVRRSGDHLLGLINDILDLSKIEAGYYTIEERAFDLIDAIGQIRSLLSEWVHSKDLWFTVEISPAVPRRIISDPQRLRQVLLNLLGNAIKFTEHGGISLRVTPAGSPDTADPENRETGETRNLPVDGEFLLQIEIADTGRGIAPAELETIFDAFVQARGEDLPPGGTGLGLTISRKILHLMGGDIVARSALQVGSTFCITLPVRATAALPAADPIGYRAIELVPGQPPRRLLVVDDRPDNRLLLTRLLSKPGLEIREAENGLEAVEVWREWHPHLIWMDLRLPVLDGYGATERIRTLEPERTTTIIALTAQVSEDDRARSLAAGCNDYLGKPFQEETLFLKMQEYLGLEYRLTGEESFRPIPGRITQEFAESARAEFGPILRTLPPQWLEELEHATASGDDTRILQLLDRIAPLHRELAAYLEDLAGQFQFEYILQLLTAPSPETE